MQLINTNPNIYLLDEGSHEFPTYDMFDDDLIAIDEIIDENCFAPQKMLQAYHNSLFPWYIDKIPKDTGIEYVHWFSPQKRMVLYPQEFKMSKSLKRTINSDKFTICSNRDFKAVISNCSTIKRKHEDSTWISDRFIQGYTQLHELGIAHSVECYDCNDNLVGGLYGLVINIKDENRDYNIFCGESMFSLVSDASKVAFYHLCTQAQENNIKLIDCQVHNNHLASLGAKEISREEYCKMLNLNQY
jgi:leucyl/phenylalanyl-tRNA--protein transferase